MVLAWMEERGKGWIERGVVEEEGGLVSSEEEEELSDHGGEGAQRSERDLTHLMTPTLFDKVRSKTRPVFLPPKPSAEDKKHLADWNSMMSRSHAAGQKKHNALDQQRLLREQRIHASQAIWETQVLPDWRIVLRVPHIRNLWWAGIPSNLRPLLWENAVGNPLALGKGLSPPFHTHRHPHPFRPSPLLSRPCKTRHFR